LVVSILRYVDLFTKFYSMYNSRMKAFYIGSSVLILYLFRRHPVVSTYRADQDSLNYWKYAILPSILFAILMSYQGLVQHGDVVKLCFIMSLLLEPLSLLPQADMFRRYQQVENLTGGAFLLLMGAYRGFYILHWIYRATNNSNKSAMMMSNQQLVLYGCAFLQVMVGFGAVCCFVERTTAPLLPQLMQFCRDLHAGWFASLLVMMLVVMTASESSFMDLSLLFDTNMNEGSYWKSTLLAIATIPLFLLPFLCLCFLVVRYKETYNYCVSTRIGSCCSSCCRWLGSYSYCCCCSCGSQGPDEEQQEEVAFQALLMLSSTDDSSTPGRRFSGPKSVRGIQIV